jgi:protein TonB
MENKRFTIFLIVSLIIHAIAFYVIRLEKVQPKKKRDLTVIDLIDKKKDKIKTAKKKPKSSILAKKDIDLKKKSKEPNKNKKPKAKKQVVLPSKPAVKKQVPVKKEPKKKVAKKEPPKKDVEKALSKKKEVEKKPQKEVKKYVPPQKKQPKSLADLNTKGIVKDFAEKEEPIASNEGDDYIDLQAVEFKYASYFNKLKEKIRRNWNYPRSSAMRGEQGTVVVQFSILKSGEITDVNVVGSSGYPALDREVRRVLNTIRAFPLPQSYNKDRIKIRANFQYILYGNGFRIW